MYKNKSCNKKLQNLLINYHKRIKKYNNLNKLKNITFMNYLKIINVCILVKEHKMITNEELNNIIKKLKKYSSYHFNKLIFIWHHKI